MNLLINYFLVAWNQQELRTQEECGKKCWHYDYDASREWGKGHYLASVSLATLYVLWGNVGEGVSWSAGVAWQGKEKAEDSFHSKLMSGMCKDKLDVNCVITMG